CSIFFKVACRACKRRASLLAGRQKSSVALLFDKLAPYSFPFGVSILWFPRTFSNLRFAICILQFAIPGTRRRGSFPFVLDLRGRELCSLLGVFHGYFIVFLEVLQLALLVIELDFRRVIDLVIPVLAILVVEDKFHFICVD